MLRMVVVNAAVIFVMTTWLPQVISQQHALFVKQDALGSGRRITRQTSADQMVQNILQWLQGVYTQNSRRIRQGTFREYLPPTNTQKPRPFQPPNNGDDSESNFIGYAPAGEYPEPPFPPPDTKPGRPLPNNPGYLPPKPGSPFEPKPFSPATTSTSTPELTTRPITEQTELITGYPIPSTKLPDATTERTSTEQVTSSQTTTEGVNGFPTAPPPSPSDVTQPPVTSQSTITYSPTTGYTEVPSEAPTASTTAFTSPSTETTTTKPSVGDNEPGESEESEDLKHPPHIHAIEVECATDMMTINIEFNRPFNGIIYSKGYYNNPDCRYVPENSGKTKYTFTVSLNLCGTEFINAFDTQGQSYLENVLVLQNEAGIQEVWDTIRAVRCLWEGNLNKALSVALSVGMLAQEIVTFSGDTAMARLDIQLGKGPFAPTANGLVKIGDTMTLVVSVSGDPGFDIQVKDCVAKDSSGENSVVLTDENGCVVKPKLFGSFQKTTNTGNTGASIIAYAYFNAFKFPDAMDLMIECNVELCKTDCEMCNDPNQKIEPGRRRRRDLYSYNESLADAVTMGKMLRVILPEDLSDGEAIINLKQRDEVCLSTKGFVLSSTLLISSLICSTVLSAYLWLKAQHTSHQKL